MQGENDEETEQVGSISVVHGAHDTNKRKRKSRKIDAVVTQPLTQEQLSQETNKVIEDISTPSYNTYKKIWYELGEKNKGDWGFNDHSIVAFLVYVRDADYSVSSRRSAVAALNELMEFNGIGSFIKNKAFPKANLLWKQIKKDTTKEKAKRAKLGLTSGEREFTDQQIETMMKNMPLDAAGAIARMDFVLGRYLGLHGAYRVQVLVQDVTVAEDGTAVFIRRSVEKNDQTGKGARSVKLCANAANPHIFPVRLTQAYLNLLPRPTLPTTRLLRNPNSAKTKLTQQVLGKNGPLRYVRYAAGFAGISKEDQKLYGTNSWRKAAANHIAKQATDAVMDVIRKGTFHKTVTATKFGAAVA